MTIILSRTLVTGFKLALTDISFLLSLKNKTSGLLFYSVANTFFMTHRIFFLFKVLNLRLISNDIKLLAVLNELLKILYFP